MMSNLDEMVSGEACSSSSALEQQGYYRGKITRLASEQLLRQDREFLIRDSISCSGQYSLTARCNGKALHFQVNVTELKGRRYYHFEEEQFDSIVDLIDFYVSHSKPITEASGCIIEVGVPKSRTAQNFDVNARELEASYSTLMNPRGAAPQTSSSRSLSQQAVINNAAIRANARVQRPQSAIDSETWRPVMVPAVPQALTSRPLPVPVRSPRNSNENEEDYDDIDYDEMDNVSVLNATNSPLHSPLPIMSRSSSAFSVAGSIASRQYQSCTNLSYRVASPTTGSRPATATTTTNPKANNNGVKPKLPPRPMLFSLPPKKEVETKADAERDSAFVDYDDVRGKEPNAHSDYDDLERCDGGMRANATRRESSIYERDSGIFNSSPSPPHECFASEACNALCNYLIESTSADIASALSSHDAALLKHRDSKELLLPNGKGMRQRLVARCQQVQLACVLSIGERRSTQILRQWIAVARILFDAGHYFSFGNVQLALLSKMALSLESLWVSLDMHSRREYAVLCKNFEKIRTAEETPRGGTPFLQAFLEIFCDGNAKFIENVLPVNDIEAFARWLSVARVWCLTESTVSMRYDVSQHSPLAPQSLAVIFNEHSFDVNMKILSRICNH